MGTVKKIFILHGWTYSIEKWGNFISSMQSKYPSTELLKIPGLTEKLEKVWELDNYIEWLNSKVSKEKGQVILIGHSNGGRISLGFTAKYPEKVANLILIDSAGIYHNELPIRLKRLVFKTIAKIGKKITTSETLRKALYKLSREEDYKNAPPIVRETMVNLVTKDITNQLSLIQTKTLIIWGEGDKITPLADGKIMHKLIKGSKIKIINGARHSPQFTHVEEVAKEINEYL